MSCSFISKNLFQWQNDAVDNKHVWLSLVLNDGDTADLTISGVIGKNWWDDSGVSGKEFRNALSQVPRGQKINLRINSEGGSVQDGLDIYNAVKERSEDVTAHITGYAVSIASVIPLAASRVISPISSVWMIHEPWSQTQGDAEEHLKAAEMLDKHGDMLAQIYSEETGKSRKAMREAMKAETWFTGAEACEFGLADETSTEDCSNSLRTIDSKLYRNIPANVLNMLRPPVSNSGPQAGQQQPPTQNTMNKKLIVALLAKHGIAALETETDEQLQAKLEQIPALAPAKLPANAASPDHAALLLQVEAMNKARIKDKLTKFVDDGKITNEEVVIYLDAALKNEDATFKILNEKKAVQIGGDPVSANINMTDPVEPFGIAGKPTEKLRNLFQTHAGDREKVYAALKKDWNHMLADAQMADRRSGVRNENSFASSLTTNFLILGATVQASPRFASVKMFARDVSVDPYKPLATGQMKFNTTVQDGSTTQTNATNFESGDSTVTNVAIAVSQYTESFHLRNTDLNSGIRMEDLIKAKLNSLGSKISKVLATNITAANYSTLSPIISTAAAFNFGNLQTLWGQLKKANSKHVMLDGPYLAKLINQPTLFQEAAVVPGAGWKNLIGIDYLALHTEWSAAGNNIIGFGCDPQALGVIAGLPLVDSPAIPGGILAQATGMIPGVDLPIAVYSWFNTSTRTYWASFDMMFGANVLDTTIGCVIASGTPS